MHGGHSGVRPHKEKINISKEIINKTRGAVAPYVARMNHTSTQRREKAVQRMLHLSGKYYCEYMSFEANEGPGSADLKVSRGNDKTVVEIKLSSNNDYLHGLEEQIESYAQAEGTNNRIFVYVMVGNPGRDKKIKEQYQNDAVKKKSQIVTKTGKARCGIFQKMQCHW